MDDVDKYMLLPRKTYNTDPQSWLDRLSDICEKIYEILRLEEIVPGYWQDLPNELILLAFTTSHHASRVLPRDIVENLRREYGFINHKTFEFLGDKIIGMINTSAQLFHNFTYEQMHSLTRVIESNANFINLMNEKNLCRGFFYGPRNFSEKLCANTLEAIVGALYYYLRKFLGLGYEALHIIETWMFTYFDIPGNVREVLPRREHTPQLEIERRLPPSPFASDEEQELEPEIVESKELKTPVHVSYKQPAPGLTPRPSSRPISPQSYISTPPLESPAEPPGLTRPELGPYPYPPMLYSVYGQPYPMSPYPMPMAQYPPSAYPISPVPYPYASQFVQCPIPVSSPYPQHTPRI